MDGCRRLVGVSLALWLCAACGGGGTTTTDSGPRDAGPDAAADTGSACTSAADCDDGLFCDGTESCDSTATGADARGCVPGASACASGETCDEDADRCLSDCDLEGDMDGDGHSSIACGGDDCDDSDALRFPGATEVCDTMNRDEDCDPVTFGFRDIDSDTFPDTRCCNMDAAGSMNCGSDCDDAQPAVHPTAVEACDELDNDCDGMVDEGVKSPFWPDVDGDDYGDPAGAMVEACFRPAGTADNMDDCDDGDALIHPGLPEICEGSVDENCNAMVDEGCSCTGTESRDCASPGVCATGTEQCTAGSWSDCTVAPTTEVCDGLDNDCDGSTDEGLTIPCFVDTDNDTYAASGAMGADKCAVSGRGSVGGCPVGWTNRAPTGSGVDCNDGDSTISPGATEVCVPLAMPPVDEDCDGLVDESLDATCYADGDNDTFAAVGATAQTLCRDESRSAWGFCPVGATATAPGSGTTDCDDTNPLAKPTGTEICDGSVDENCDGTVDEGCSCVDGTSQPCSLPGVCAAGIQNCSAGVLSACSISPTPEVCNTLDDDCDGDVDEGVKTTCYADGDGDGYAPLGAATSQVCGACGGGSTSRAPTGGDVDCDDGDGMINPGVAIDPCNGVDNDCSSGGGLDSAEDADGDGHTAAGFTGCTGGFPKDDCNDGNIDVFPGQTSYFATPICSAGTCTCGLWPYSYTGCRFILPGGGSSCTCPATATLNWDYNCDDSISKRYGSSVPVCGCFGFGGCFGHGFSSDVACGQLATLSECSGSCSTTCSASSTRTARQLCR